MSKSNDYKSSPLCVPPEVLKKHPKITVLCLNGYLYAQRKGRRIAISKIVWAINHPTNPLKKGQRLYYIDGDKLNNSPENLTTNRTMKEASSETRT